MKAIQLILPLWFAGLASAAQGPAGASGPCSRVIGPVDSLDQPIGFTCADIGGSAFLVWNASQLTGDITITGGVRSLNYHPGSFSIAGNYVSDGPVAFVAGSLAVGGSVVGSSVLLVGTSATENEVKQGLLGSTQRLTSNSPSTASVTIGATGSVKATTGNLVVGANSFVNVGSLEATQKNVIVVVGSTLDVGWDDVTWLAGARGGGSGPFIRNDGAIEGRNVHLEARRTDIGDSITNRPTGVVKADETITLVTGLPGRFDSPGVLEARTFGISNRGTMEASSVTIRPLSPGTPAADGTFSLKDEAQRAEAERLLGGIFVFPHTDNTPGGSTSVVNTSTATGAAQPTTANLVIPQLAVSVTHMNSTATARTPIAVASNNRSEVVRGAAPGSASAAKKPRVKAKPVLVRGGFFNSKISAKITASR